MGKEALEDMKVLAEREACAAILHKAAETRDRGVEHGRATGDTRLAELSKAEAKALYGAEDVIRARASTAPASPLQRALDMADAFGCGYAVQAGEMPTVDEVLRQIVRRAEEGDVIGAAGMALFALTLLHTGEALNPALVALRARHTAPTVKR